MEAGFSSSEKLVSRSSDIEFIGTFAIRRIIAFNSDFINVISKSFSNSDSLFEFSRKFSRGEEEFFFPLFLCEVFYLSL